MVILPAGAYGDLLFRYAVVARPTGQLAAGGVGPRQAKLVAEQADVEQMPHKSQPSSTTTAKNGVYVMHSKLA